MQLYPASLEPAAIDRTMQREATQASMCAYGDFDVILQTPVEKRRRDTCLTAIR